MDKTALVTQDQETLNRILQALSRAKIPVSLVDWNYDSEIEEWQLVIATPLYDSRGPREAVSRVIKSLEDAGIYQEVPIRRVSVLSPADSLVKTLKEEVKDLTEGNIHILAHDADRPNHAKEYSVIFAPFAGRGGFVPAKHITELAELRKFLEESLHIRRTLVEDVLLELARKGDTSIFNVQLTSKERKRLGLA